MLKFSYKSEKNYFRKHDETTDEEYAPSRKRPSRKAARDAQVSNNLLANHSKTLRKTAEIEHRSQSQKTFEPKSSDRHKVSTNDQIECSEIPTISLSQTKASMTEGYPYRLKRWH